MKKLKWITGVISVLAVIMFWAVKERDMGITEKDHQHVSSTEHLKIEPTDTFIPLANQNKPPLNKMATNKKQPSIPNTTNESQTHLSSEQLQQLNDSTIETGTEYVDGNPATTDVEFANKLSAYEASWDQIFAKTSNASTDLQTASIDYSAPVTQGKHQDITPPSTIQLTPKSRIENKKRDEQLVKREQNFLQRLDANPQRRELQERQKRLNNNQD